MLDRVGKVLGFSPEAIKNFNEEAILQIISSTFDNGSIGYQRNEYCTFNPLDKEVELYERLQAEKDRADTLERLLKEK